MSTAVMPMIAPRIMPMALIVALAERRPSSATTPFDILDDDDGVIDKDADRHDHREQRKGVDGEAEGRETETAAKQRDRNHKRRDHCRAPALEEQEHDEEHQQHRLDQRLDHIVDRGLDERRGVVGDRPGDVLRKPRSSFVIRAESASLVAMASDPELSWTASPAILLAVERRSEIIQLSAASSTRATSPSRTVDPSGSARTMIAKPLRSGEVVLGHNARIERRAGAQRLFRQQPPPAVWLFCS